MRSYRDDAALAGRDARSGAEGGSGGGPQAATFYGRFLRALRFEPPRVAKSPESIREAQVAQDAYALCHQLAESVLRLAHATLSRAKAGREGSLWQHLSDSPQSVRDVIDEVGDLVEGQQGYLAFAHAVLPRVNPDDQAGVSALNAAVKVLYEWLDYARHLVSRQDIDLNAVHNKIKHGPAISSRTDTRVDMFDHALGEVATVSEVNDPVASPVRGPSIEAIHRAPALKNVRTKDRPWEATTVVVEIPDFLAECHMLGLLYGALFHNAAREWFSSCSRHRCARQPPPYPGLPVVGPHPPHLRRNATGEVVQQPVGIRQPLTTVEEYPKPRGLGLEFSDDFVGLKYVSGARRVKIIPDREVDEASQPSA